MRKLWVCDNWSEYIDSSCRKGLRLRFDKEVDTEVHRACLEFAQWLRKEYEFPMRLPVYFKNTFLVRTPSGEMASAYFFAPYEKTVEPYISIAVGDYLELMSKWGKDNALAAILSSMIHEISHYFQWLKNYDFIWDEDKKEKQAKYYSKEILMDYAETRDHP